VPYEPEGDNVPPEGALEAGDATAKIIAARARLAELRDLRLRAQSASANTLTLDKSAPLLLGGEGVDSDLGPADPKTTSSVP